MMKTARHQWTILSVFFLAPVLLLSACQSDEEQLQGFMKRGDEYKDSEQFEDYFCPSISNDAGTLYTLFPVIV